jgi:hypothetical protein
MLRRMAIVRTDVSEQRITSIIGMTRIGILHSRRREKLRSYNVSSK